MLLLVLPEDAFEAIVPVLILLGWCSSSSSRGSPRGSPRATRRSGRAAGRTGAWWVWPAVLLTGVYGGYFGAAQGVLLMAVLGIGIAETLQRLNAVKNVLALLVNAVAGVLFVFVADVDWPVVALIGVGSIIGGQARRDRRAPAAGRGAAGDIVIVGLPRWACSLR